MAATIVAIGDELVSGYTLDTNSNWIAQHLRRLGRPQAGRPYRKGVKTRADLGGG